MSGVGEKVYRADGKNPIVGSGKYRYELIQGWGSYPEGILSNGIACDSQDRVYITTFGIGTDYPKVRPLPAPVVFVNDSDGNSLGSWGTGACEHAHGMNIVDDQIFFTDKHHSICLSYTLDGKILQLLGRRGAHSDTGCKEMGTFVPHPAGPFNRPNDFTRAPWGDLYAADGTHNTRIHRFDSGGHLIQSWGWWGDEPGQFKEPHSVLPVDGKLYVCDRQNHRVQVFTPEGKVLGVWTGLQWPCHIVKTPEGDFAIGENAASIGENALHGSDSDENAGNQLVRADSEDRSEAKAKRPSGIRILDKDGKLITALDAGSAHWMAQDSKGNIYVANHWMVNKLVRL